MKLPHTRAATSAVFDDPNLVSVTGLVPVLALADSADPQRLAGEHLSVPTDKGANAGLKVVSLVAGSVAGADSIDDMALLRHGGWGGCSRMRTRPRRWARSCGVRGLNALLATVSTQESAPVIVAQRLRKGSCGSPRGAKRLVADALKTVGTLVGTGSDHKPLLRGDWAGRLLES